MTGHREERGDAESVAEHEHRRTGETDGISGGDAEEDVAHVHDGRIAEHRVEALLRDGDEADVEDVQHQQNQEQVRPLFRALGEQRDGDAHQSVETELFQHARVQHRGRSRRAGVCAGCPRVEWDERDEHAEADEQPDVDSALRGCGDEAGRLCHHDHVERAVAVEQRDILREVELREADEQDDAAGGEIDGDAPRGGMALAVAPDADEQESRDERELVEGVEEEQVERCKRARCACADEQDARVE